MKPNFTLRMPPYSWRPAPGLFNTAIVAPRTWARVPVRERDRDVLPVLHARGYVNAAAGRPLSSGPGATPLGQPDYVQPATYWGKQGRLLKTPRSILFRGPQAYGVLYNSAADLANLSAAGVFLAAVSTPNQYYGCFAVGTPWATAPTGLCGNLLSGLLPTIDGSTFAGGDVLVIVQAAILSQTAYYDSTNFNGPPSFPVDANAELSALLNSDVAQLAAALGSFRKLRLRVYSDQLAVAAEVAWFNGTIVPAATGAGIDASYTGPTGTPGNLQNVTLAQLQNDYHSFFGI